MMEANPTLSVHERNALVKVSFRNAECSGGEVGRRAGFRFQWPKGYAGSNPAPSTILPLVILKYLAFVRPRSPTWKMATRLERVKCEFESRRGY